MGVRSALLVLFRRIARIYFREIEVAPSEQRRERLVALAAERTSLMKELDTLRERAEGS